MATAIAIVVLMLIVIFALKGVFKRIKGGGSCCGADGAAFVPPKKLDGPIVSTMVVEIEGMHCDNCKSKVENAINNVDGLRGNVSLYNGKLKVEAIRNVTIDEIAIIVNKAGYKVIALTKK